jgi:hypothetical protein
VEQHAPVLGGEQAEGSRSLRGGHAGGGGKEGVAPRR